MSEGVQESQQGPESREGQQQGGEGAGFTPPATQQELNRIIAERVKREAAKYADYSDLKGKAAELDKLTEASKTEVQKATDRVTAAEAEVAKIPAKVAEALKGHLVTLHSISDEDAELFLTATEPDLLLKQVARLTGRETDRKKNHHVPREGNNPPAGATDDRDFVRGFFGGGDG